MQLHGQYLREPDQDVARAVDWSVQPAGAPTNNAAERALRDYVIKRKLSYCTRSKRGMDFTERIFSTVQTCKMQGRVAYDFICEAVQSWCAHLRPPSLVPEHIHLHHTCA